MDGIMHIGSVRDYNDYFGVATLHPLVSVIDGRDAKPLRFGRKLYGIYAVLLKDGDCGELHYGRSKYDYGHGTMLFIAPWQTMGSRDDGRLHRADGWALCFAPELLHGTQLGETIKDYTYFSYTANEALHLSGDERAVVIGCLTAIRDELRHPADRHSLRLVADNIRLLLDHCLRFYDRQFATRHSLNGDVLARFERFLDDYYGSGKAAERGIPTVQVCADNLCLSANYLSDLLRRETGKAASWHIQKKTLDIAKQRLAGGGKSISEISYGLGFQYPQHFSRWFKRLAGCPPNEYRKAD